MRKTINCLASEKVRLNGQDSYGRAEKDGGGDVPDHICYDR